MAPMLARRAAAPYLNPSLPRAAVSAQLERVRSALATSFAVERELGAGGMATVYLAEDLKRRMGLK